MCMKRTKIIYSVVAVVCAALMMVACSNDSDTTLTSQQKAIENYLTKSHKPALIDEYLVPESSEEQPQFYTHWGLDIFRYIATYYDEGREEWTTISKGTTFDINYTAYIFKNGQPTISDMFATNIAENIEELYKQYPDEEHIWEAKPMRITLGETALVSGLNKALEGCRIGDRIEVYLTYEAAYGKHYVGFVPSKSSVMWEIEILEAK